MRRNTSTSYVIDTHAWVEYLLGSKAGETARQYIEGGLAMTPSIVLLELRKWYLREVEAERRRDDEMTSHLAFVASRTDVVPLDASLALKAGDLDNQMKRRIKGWPVADSIVLATARAKSSKLVSGDPHFRRIEDVIYIG